MSKKLLKTIWGGGGGGGGGGGWGGERERVIGAVHTTLGGIRSLAFTGEGGGEGYS